MKLGDIDRLCFMNYVLGGLVLVSSFIGFFVDLFFKNLFWRFFQFSHKSIGFLQTIIAIVFFLVFVLALEFIKFTMECQQAHGA